MKATSRAPPRVFDITEAQDNFAVDSNNTHSTYGMAADTLTSDSNGNQTYDGTQVYVYDGWNRLKTVSHGYRDTSSVLHHGQSLDTMSYDARGRRIIKAVIGTGSWDCTYHYYMDKDSVIEEQNGSAQSIKQFVWGKSYIDELIQTALNSSPTTQTTCDTLYWTCQDANWNALGVVNSSGVLRERYEYTPYGERQVYFSPGSNDVGCYAPIVGSQKFVAGSTAEPWGICEVGHQGLMHDEECGLVYNRARYLSSSLGRFLQRDPVDYRDSYNLYEYCHSNPMSSLDASGLGGGSGKNNSKPAPLVYQSYPFVPGRGTFTITISQGSDKDTGLPENNGAYVKINFHPNASVACKCTKIDFVQYVETKASWLGYAPWELDNGNDPYKPVAENRPWTGAAGGSAVMTDNPDSTADYYMIHGRSQAICRAGAEANKSYGTVEWVLEFDKSKNTKTYIIWGGSTPIKTGAYNSAKLTNVGTDMPPGY